MDSFALLRSNTSLRGVSAHGLRKLNIFFSSAADTDDTRAPFSQPSLIEYFASFKLF